MRDWLEWEVCKRWFFSLDIYIPLRKIQSTAVVAIGERKEISKAIFSSRPEWTGSSTQEKALAFSDRGDIHSVTGKKEVSAT